MLSTIESEKSVQTKLEESLSILKSETPTVSTNTRTNRSVDLFLEEESTEMDGIEVFGINEDEDEQIIEELDGEL